MCEWRQEEEDEDDEGDVMWTWDEDSAGSNVKINPTGLMAWIKDDKQRQKAIWEYKGEDDYGWEYSECPWDIQVCVSRSSSFPILRDQTLCFPDFPLSRGRADFLLVCTVPFRSLSSSGGTVQAISTRPRTSTCEPRTSRAGWT